MSRKFAASNSSIMDSIVFSGIPSFSEISSQLRIPVNCSIIDLAPECFIATPWDEVAMVTELSCVEVSELIKTPFFKRGKIGAVLDDVVIGQELLLPRPCVFAPR